MAKVNEDDRTPRTDLKGYFKGLSDRIDRQVSLMTPVIVHSGEMGDNDHHWFADFLRQYLPQRIGVDTGFVVNLDSDKGSADFFAAKAGPRTADKSIGPQTDILLLDVLHNAPFCSEKTFKVCPVEMVLSVIEVTRTLTTAKLDEDLEKVSRVRDLAKKKKYANFDHENPDGRPLFGFLVAFASDVAEETLVKKVLAIDPGNRPLAVLVMGTGLYTFTKDKTFTITEDPLFKFLAVLRSKTEGLPLGSVDLFAYLPPMASLLAPFEAKPADGPPAK